MRNVRHSGNTCTVGATCFTFNDMTDEERRTLSRMGVDMNHGSCYAHVGMDKWPAVFTYLKFLGHDVPFVGDYATDPHYGQHKILEWKYHFKEIN